MRTTVILLLLILIIYWSQYQNLTSISVTGNSTARKWQVVGSYDNSDEAAQALSRLHDRLLIFFRYLGAKYHISETADEIAAEGREHISGGHKREIAYHILRDYNPDRVFENNPEQSSDTSYTINKGSSLFMCLRDRADTNVIEHDDLLLFVMLHELSHIGNIRSWGHDAGFWQVFKHVLREAEMSGIYKPIVYSKNPDIFCGLEITYNPYFDASLPAIAD